jgi:hypothetical protein
MKKSIKLFFEIHKDVTIRFDMNSSYSIWLIDKVKYFFPESKLLDNSKDLSKIRNYSHCGLTSISPDFSVDIFFRGINNPIKKETNLLIDHLKMQDPNFSS